MPAPDKRRHQADFIIGGEADTVRDIMQRYIDADWVRTPAAELQRDGIVSKRRTMSDGSVHGVPMKRGAISCLLSNRIYIGETVHKDNPT
jgi:site-specific DNA recombinase